MTSSHHPYRPRVLLLVDKRGWALHDIALAIETHLSGVFSFDIQCSAERPLIDESRYDLIHVLYDYENYHLPFLHGRTRVIKSVFSHYWQTWDLSPREFYDRHLSEAHAITVPSTKLHCALRDLPVPITLFPEGVDTDLFLPMRRRSRGPLVIGWAGDPTRGIKRLDWLKEACDGVATLRLAVDVPKNRMPDFYNSVDVVACSSLAEGCPRPILEGMACGCFPVSFDVGVVSELVQTGINGIVVHDESIDGLRSALQWCVEHIDDVRSTSILNAERVRADRQWKNTAQHLGSLYRTFTRQAVRRKSQATAAVV